MEDSGELRAAGGGQGAGGSAVEGWSIELADDRIAVHAVDCVPGAGACATSRSLG